ncbi:hypothetical protein F2P81_026069 [Scophthalmus maximus]|uniref:Uncharacterized protein n=1 Tax=Scophthalmus maximus TaxID=52904 RepID=A0A6A4RND0_SCOMX|nr:hypothetical protein F2P81_026069 [Scophthalmus maximus]
MWSSGLVQVHRHLDSVVLVSQQDGRGSGDDSEMREKQTCNRERDKPHKTSSCRKGSTAFGDAGREIGTQS